jgi:hypothetical protein
MQDIEWPRSTRIILARRPQLTFGWDAKSANAEHSSIKLHFVRLLPTSEAPLAGLSIKNGRPGLDIKRKAAARRAASQSNKQL